MRFALWITAVLAAGCHGAGQPSSAPPGGEGPRAALRVEGQAFTLETRELVFALEWPGGAGRRVSLEIYAPGGALYQRMAAPVDADGRARFVLPVAGTPIGQYRLAGAWEVRAYAAGDETVLASAEVSIAER